jgi:hypothetical protein
LVNSFGETPSTTSRVRSERLALLDLLVLLELEGFSMNMRENIELWRNDKEMCRCLREEVPEV